jgi:hypothetical protein
MPLRTTPGEGKRTKRAQGYLKRSGYKTGWPDIEVTAQPQRFVELRLPAASCRRRSSMLRKLEYCGAPFCCAAVPEVEAGCAGWASRLRGTVAA